MKFLIIGHSVEDQISSGKNQDIKPGGIFYTASALNYLKENSDEIFLCTAVERNNLKLFSPLYENLDKKYFEFVDEIPKVILKIYENKEREEFYKNITCGLKINFEDISSFDGIILNMITGFDIDLDQMKKIRKNFKGLIYMDIHTFSRGIEKKIINGEKVFKRNFRNIPNFKEWAENIDIVQVNENELLTLSEESTELKIVEEVLKAGLKYIIITKGKLGSKIYFRNNEEINSMFKSSLKVETHNKIGCGDVFGAAFFYTYFKSKDISKSLETANAAGGIAASYYDLNEIKNLRKDVFARYN